MVAAVPDGASFFIFLLDVMALEEARGVSVVEGGRDGARYFEENIHPDGEVGGVQKTHLALFHQLPDARQLRIPTRGAYDHVHAQADAGFNVAEHGGWRSEVNDGGDAFGGFGGQAGGVLVFFHVESEDVMALFAGDISDQRACFSAA